MTKEDFVKNMTVFGMAYNKEFSIPDIEMYYEFLGKYESSVLTRAIKKLIQTNKFMPKISELIESCENSKIDPKMETLDYMYKKGYFKEYSSEEETYYRGRPSEYERTINLVKKNLIPKWLLEDMRKYYIMMKSETKQLNSEERIMIE